jgi:hypothetical protein
MSDITANIIVQPFDINITLEQPGITINPEVIGLNIYAVGGTNGVPAGNVGDLQYYAANGFAAIPSNTANYTGNTLNLNVNNTKIPGGTNGYVLQTDGAGNLTWTAQTGGGGNGSPGGSNTQIQYNDNGLFGGTVGFTFDEVSGNVNIPGNLNIGGNLSAPISANYANFAGNIINSAQPNITSVGNLTSLNVTGNISANNMFATTFNGILNGNATTAATVTTNAQPNITSVGTLNGLTINGITKLTTGIENITIISAPTGTYNLDVLTSPIRYATNNSTANITLNVRGNSTTTLDSLLTNGQSITVSYAVTTGSSPFGITSLSVDGSTVTPKFAGSTAISANSIITYTYTLIKNSGVFTALGSITRYT